MQKLQYVLALRKPQQHLIQIMHCYSRAFKLYPVQLCVLCLLTHTPSQFVSSSCFFYACQYMKLWKSFAGKSSPLQLYYSQPIKKKKRAVLFSISIQETNWPVTAWRPHFFCGLPVSCFFSFFFFYYKDMKWHNLIMYWKNYLMQWSVSFEAMGTMWTAQNSCYLQESARNVSRWSYSMFLCP